MNNTEKLPRKSKNYPKNFDFTSRKTKYFNAGNSRRTEIDV